MLLINLPDTLPQFNNSMDNSQYNIPGATVIIDFGLKVKGEALYLWNGKFDLIVSKIWSFTIMLKINNTFITSFKEGFTLVIL